MTDPFIGEIIMFAGNFAPRDWALCDGQLLTINANQSLFSILGTNYGGDGRTTFGLPDLRGRVPVGVGQGPNQSDRARGVEGGTETVPLTEGEMPSHTHTAVLPAGLSAQLRGRATPDGDASSPDPAVVLSTLTGLGGVTINPYSTSDVSTTPIAGGADVDVTVTNAGGGQPHNNLQPYEVINYIIALAGIYPSRN